MNSSHELAAQGLAGNRRLLGAGGTGRQTFAAPGLAGAIAPMAGAAAVYAYGTIQARFPSLSVEKEFFQAIELNNLPDKDIYDVSNATDLKRLNELINAKNSLYEVLGKPGNFYIAREMCWLLQSRRNQTLYLLDTRNDARVEELVGLLRVDNNNQKTGVVAVGQLRPLASTWACNGINAPVAELLSLAPVDPDGFCRTLQPKINGFDVDKCRTMVKLLLTLTDNAGSTDEQRALNYALLNYLKIHEVVYSQLYGGGTDCYGKPLGDGGYRLDGVRAEPAAGAGRQVRLLFSFVGNQPGARQLWYCVINVAGDYPFVAEGLIQTLSLG